jgi:hypothetical protein
MLNLLRSNGNADFANSSDCPDCPVDAGGFYVHYLTRPKLPGLCGFFSQVFLDSTRKNFRMDRLAAV